MLVARRVHRRLLVADLVDDLVAVAVAGEGVERQGEGHRLSLPTSIGVHGRVGGQGLGTPSCKQGITLHNIWKRRF